MPDIYDLPLQIHSPLFSTLFSTWEAELCGPHEQALVGDQRIEKGGDKLASGCLGPSPLLTA